MRQKEIDDCNKMVIIPKPQFGKTRNSLSSFFSWKYLANAIRNIWVNLQLEVKRYSQFFFTLQKFREINFFINKVESSLDLVILTGKLL